MCCIDRRLSLHIAGWALNAGVGDGARLKCDDMERWVDLAPTFHMFSQIPVL